MINAQIVRCTGTDRPVRIHLFDSEGEPLVAKLFLLGAIDAWKDGLDLGLRGLPLRLEIRSQEIKGFLRRGNGSQIRGKEIEVGIPANDPGWLAVAGTELDERMGDLGCKLCLLNFGAGNSSLSSLTRFSVNKVEIDGSFFEDDSAGLSPVAEAVVQTLRGTVASTGGYLSAGNVASVAKRRELYQRGIAEWRSEDGMQFSAA